MAAAEFLLGMRWVLGVILATAGAMKLRALHSFEQRIGDYRLVPRFLHRPVARSLPTAEIAVGAALILGALPMLAGWFAFILLLAFASAVGWNLARGRQFECGCATIGDGSISGSLVLRDLGLAAIAAAIAVGPSGSLAVLRGSSGPATHALGTADLVPAPMLAILVLGVMRVLVASRSRPTSIRFPGRSGHDRRGHLALVQANDSDQGARQVR